MSLVRAFKEQSADQSHQSLIKETSKFAGELGTSQDLSSPDPNFRNWDGAEVPMVKIRKKNKIRQDKRRGGKGRF